MQTKSQNSNYPPRLPSQWGALQRFISSAESVIAIQLRVRWLQKCFQLMLLVVAILVPVDGVAQQNYGGEFTSPSGIPNSYVPPIVMDVPQIDFEKAYMVKSVYLLRFTRFISWPNFADSKDFHFGVLGDSPIVAPLQKVKSKVNVVTDKISGKKLPMRVSQFANVDDIEACHILFIGESTGRADVLAVIERFGGTQTLIVGETPEFVDEGGSVGLVIVGQSVNFVVNVAAAKEQGLTYSAQMLKAAYRVVDKTPAKPSASFSDTRPESAVLPGLP